MTLCSRMMRVRTLRQVSTPRSSRGRWSGKSTMLKRVWSGRANIKGWCSDRGRIASSTRVLPGMGTGALSSRRIHVSMSWTSCITNDDVVSDACPVKRPHTVSLSHLQLHNSVILIIIYYFYYYYKISIIFYNCYRIKVLVLQYLW